MKQLTLSVLCLSALAGCMTTPEISDNLRDPADKELAGTEEVAESAYALQGGLLPNGLVDVACPVGFRTSTYHPGLTLAPRQVNIASENTFGGCISLTRPSLSFGVIEATPLPVIASCLLTSAIETKTIHWNDGTWSTYSATSVVHAKPNGTTVLLFNGPVTDGLFKGSQIEIVLTLLATDLLGCYTDEGVTESSGTTVLTITTPL